MQFKTWFKSKPLWLKGGLVGLSIYIVSLIITLSLTMVGNPILEKYPDLLPPGSLGFLIPFIAISFYPTGIFFLGASYDPMKIVILLNSIIYFVGGALVGLTLNKKRK